MYTRPSPDGKSLAFVEWKAGNLAVLDVASGATRALTKDASFVEPVQMAQFSAWSRDSSRIAFQWDVMVPQNFREEIRILSVSGDTTPAVIRLPGASWFSPSDWSPDGTRIVGVYGGDGGSRTAALANVASRTIDRLNLPPSSWLEYRFTEDGNAILHSAPADGKAGPNDIFLLNLRTGISTPVIQHPAEDQLVGVLPGTEWLFFASDRRGRLDLWAVPFRQGKAAGQSVLVKQGLGRFYPLGFTNDGRYYYATLSAVDDVYLADLDPGTDQVTGEARKLVTRWDGVSSGPAFSPDGASLAYVVKRSPMPIPVHTADSLVVQSLKDPKAEPVVVGFDDVGLSFVRDPCWSADGKAIVVYGSRVAEQGSALYRVELPTLRKTEISVAGEDRLLGHDCGTSGPFVYAVLAAQVPGETAGQVHRIIRTDLGGGAGREVFRAPQGQNTGGFAVSPDGRSLSVVTNLDRNRRALLMVPSEGGTPKQILEFRQPTGGGVALVWAPDGRSIFYVVRSEERTGNLSFELHRVRLDGATASPDLVYKWAGQFFGLRFHPNGRLLAFTGRSTYSSSSEVWVIENLRDELKMLAPVAKRP